MKKIGVGFETGFCHFCKYETETHPYAVPPEIDVQVWLCDFCAQLTRRDMSNAAFRPLNWGLNHILAQLKQLSTLAGKESADSKLKEYTPTKTLTKLRTYDKDSL